MKKYRYHLIPIFVHFLENDVLRAPAAAAHPNPGFQKRGKEKSVMGIILIIILVLLLIGALPTWGHSKSWGPYPSGGIGLILLILIILLLLGRI